MGGSKTGVGAIAAAGDMVGWTNCGGGVTSSTDRDGWYLKQWDESWRGDGLTGRSHGTAETQACISAHSPRFSSSSNLPSPSQFSSLFFREVSKSGFRVRANGRTLCLLLCKSKREKQGSLRVTSGTTVAVCLGTRKSSFLCGRTALDTLRAVANRIRVSDERR
jgi:hypothetical protein